MTHEGFSVATAFVNSNIHPKEEYALRIGTWMDYAKTRGIPTFEGAYDPQLWEKTVGVHGGPYPLLEAAPGYRENLAQRQVRCAACYRLRFEELASLASQNGFAAISSTLTISPYQFTPLILAELERAAHAVGLQAVAHDFSEHYAETSRRSRELGMYRQNYCGCRYSQEEAQLERAERKAARKVARKAARKGGGDLPPSEHLALASLQSFLAEGTAC
jgi:predicted adenine nucleotide alpha hydrolase (AANH) superfamily ATPase